MNHSVLKYIVAPNIRDLRAYLDVPAKIHFIGHNCLTKNHLVWEIGLNKLNYGSKEFLKVKLV